MNTQPSSAPSALTIVLYTLAAVAFLLALVLLIVVLNLDAAVESNAFLLRSIMGPLADVLLAGLLSAAQIVGVLMITMMGSIGILLVGGGQLAAGHTGLVARVLRLEQILVIDPAPMDTNQAARGQAGRQEMIVNQG